MSSNLKEAGQLDDELLQEMSDALDETLPKLEESPSHAVFILGVKHIQPDADKAPEGGVETIIAASGFYGVLAEGLYAELRDQLENGHTGLFEMLRMVIDDLEEDLGIEHDEELSNGDPSTHLH